MQERGVIQASAQGLRLAQDYTFDSPSAAAGVLLGYSVNGREAWKDANGRTLKENQTATVAERDGLASPGP